MRVIPLAGLAMLLSACSHVDGRPPVQVGGVPPHVAVPLVDASAPPRIVQIWLSRDAFGSGDRVAGQVTTSSNVASVEARVGGFGLPLHRIEFGRFAATHTVPTLPSFVKRTFDLRIIARSANGEQRETSIPIQVR
jgi:hypothetical protein